MPPFTRLAPLALIVLAACASGDRPQRGAPGNGGPGGDARGGRADGFTQAASLVDEGRYAEALPALRCVATRGEGFEIAQYLAGYSALRLSRSDETPDVLRAEYRVEGFERMTAAAQAGWPAAQAGLAEAHFESGTGEAIAEAAYWAAVYRSNTRERMYGLDRLDNAVETRIADRLGEAGVEAAETRATSFSITPLPAGEAGPECAPYLRASGEGIGSSEGGRRGNGGGRGGGQRPGGGRGG